MLKALEKRPVDSERIEQAVSSIKKELILKGEREFPTREVGELVMQALSKLDHVAFVRFASVYRSFQDVNEFTKVIENLKK
jgi:transcriptional repressor NrdR